MKAPEKHPDPRIAQALALLKIRKPAAETIRRRAAALLGSDDPPDAERVLPLVALDPLAAVWVLKQANSSYYGLRSTVDSLSRAIDVLSAETVARMLAETPDAPGEPSPRESHSANDGLARHAVATGVLASSLAGERSPQGGFLFTAGLLHDVGKTVFANNYPVEASKMYEESRLWESLREADLGAVEQLAFGLDHREVGEYVARKMQFPENLTEVLRYHASPSALPSDHPTHRPSWIVHMASVAATGLGYAAGSAVSWDDCRRDPRWRQTLEERLIPHASEDVLFASCEDAIRDIESLLHHRAEPETPFMKSTKRTKRANREPVAGERSPGPNSGTQGESAQTHNTRPD